MTAPLALTWGDPAGIGGEIACKAWAARPAPFFLIADIEKLAPVAAAHGIALRTMAEPPASAADEAHAGDQALPVLHHPCPTPVIPGQPDHANAAATVEMIERAVRLVQAGAASALVTNPISKQVLKQGAGFAFPGHTEFLAHLSGDPDALPVMMLAAPELRAVPLTIHIPLAEVPTAVTAPLLRRTLQVLHKALIRDFGIPAPRIAVAGLNPHAGEGGVMGREEIEIIAPVLDEMRGQGMSLLGPLPADTMFHPPARARYDAALCMYHDQALIPLKTLNFSAGVNVTLGLPFVRTSPDHGTAFDIAGTGQADADSLIAALSLAAEMAARRAG